MYIYIYMTRYPNKKTIVKPQQSNAICTPRHCWQGNECKG